MSEIPLCTIVISSRLPQEEVENLETLLELSSIELQKSTSRVVGADDIVFIAAVLGGITAAADLIERGIKIAKVIASWRKELRSQDIEPEGRLEHPNRPPLDLSTATDEELEEWFTQR